MKSVVDRLYLDCLLGVWTDSMYKSGYSNWYNFFNFHHIFLLFFFCCSQLIEFLYFITQDNLIIVPGYPLTVHNGYR